MTFLSALAPRWWLRPSAVLLVCATLAACASHPVPPAWQSRAQSASERAITATLVGEQRIATLEWERARQALASTARPDLLARLELQRCAALFASLQPLPCPGFDALAADASAADHAYAAYLAGQASAAQAALLPTTQQALWRYLHTPAASPAGVLALLTDTRDPLARLVAAAAALQAGQADAQVMALASDTASSQGWRRPLLAWLLLQERAAQQAQDSATAAALRRRIALLQPPH